MSNETTRGKKLSTLELEIMGGIDVQDLLLRTDQPLETSTPPTLLKLRQIHHEIARLLSSGLKEAEVAGVTGYSLSRISNLKNDPSFKELLAYYQARQEEIFVDVRKRLATLGVDAVAELQDRLDYKADSMTNTQLIEITKASLDRAGFNPVNKNETISVQMSSDELAKLKASQGGGNVRVIESLSQDFEVTNSKDNVD